ncbi:hypothetical protein D3C72_817880 [compost metagenome]
MVGPPAYTRLITPSGNPASFRISMNTLAEYTWVLAGFHTITLPHIAGAVGRLPPIAVKLNGVIASTKPSSARYSIRLFTPGAEIGCCA